MLNPGSHYAVVDFETRSEVDLKACGAYEYAVHASTSVLCVAWKVWKQGTSEPTSSWSPFFNSSDELNPLRQILDDPSIFLVAHNAFFEQMITEHLLRRFVPPERWICTASMAAALALPRSLEGAGSALGLDIQKDKEGHRLMLKYCKPRRATIGDKSKWHSDDDEIRRLIDYCVRDVDVEFELLRRLPNLNKVERKVWCLDQKINRDGFLVDKKLIKKTLKLIKKQTEALDDETKKITKGEIQSTRQRASILGFINQSNTVPLPDLRANTVSQALGSGKYSGETRRLLEIRQESSKSSTAKYQALEVRSRHDGRVRDNLLYHGASTGRWSGRGIQVQNLPRQSIKNIDLACEVVGDGDLEMVKLLWGNPMEVFSSCIRAMIIADRGSELFCADYASIEARVLFWCAEHEVGLEMYRNNQDLYIEMAAAIFNKSISEISKSERTLGKSVILGAGYQMGHKKFYATCLNYGIEIDEQLADRAISAYRTTHYPVKALWGEIEEAAIAAIQTGKSIRCGKVVWFVGGDFLYCQLPSGRRIAYYKAEVRYEPNKFTGEKSPKLYHWGTNSTTHQWECVPTYGGRLVENVVQAIARDLMAWAMLRIDRAGYKILFTCHDEIVATAPKNCSIEDFCNLMKKVPKWGEGLPIAVEGYTSFRYRK